MIQGDTHMYADDTTVYVSASTYDLVASKLNESKAIYMVLWELSYSPTVAITSLIHVT